MGFVTPALLAGSVLVAVPILLHLMMRHQPQHLTFPALRFVQQKHETNRRRMRYRHLLLLALRCVLIGGLAFALARPSFRGSDLHGKQGGPLALALVLDNSLRMQYVSQQQPLLEKARDMAVHMIDQLQATGSVVVLDRGRMVNRHLSEPSIARTRLKGLTYSSHPRPMEDTVLIAIELVNACEECRQEVVVFTDMTQASLTETTIEQIAAALEEAPSVHLYLVDVGVDKPQNLALGDLHMNSEILTPGEVLHLELKLQAGTASEAADGGATDQGQEGTLGQASSEDVSTSKRSQNDRSLMDNSQVLVELYLNDAQGQPVKRGQQWYSPAGPSQSDPEIVFELTDLALGTHQGSIHLALADSLMLDNTRYFTAVVHSPARVLLVGNTDRDTLFVREALSPSILGLSTQDLPSKSRSADLKRVEVPLSPAGPNRADLTNRMDLKGVRFLCDSVRYADLAQTSLDSYDAVGLLDPPVLSETIWQDLVDFTSAGRGVGIFLGHHASRQAFNRESTAARLLLPGQLRRRSREITYFSPQRYDHPALKELTDYAADIPWPIYPVLQFWEFGELAADTRVIARFHNHQPALFARVASSGRVLTMTTPLSDPREPRGRESWNLLPTGPEPWPFVLLTDNLFGFLTQESNQRTMFQAGETISIPLTPRQQVSSFILQQPDGHSLRQTLPPGQDAIRISTAETLGNYRLAAGGKLHLLDHGFSINTSAKSSLLTRVDSARLSTALPSERVHISRTVTEVQREIDIGQSGQDLFPWAIFLVAIVWGTEHLLANRFYREPV